MRHRRAGFAFYGRIARLDTAALQEHASAFDGAIAVCAAGIMPTYAILQGATSRGCRCRKWRRVVVSIHPPAPDATFRQCLALLEGLWAKLTKAGAPVPIGGNSAGYSFRLAPAQGIRDAR